MSLGGQEVNAYEVEDAVLRRAPGVLDYQLVIGRREGKDLVTVRLEVPDEAARAAVDVHAVAAGVREQLRVACQVGFGRADAITSTGAMVSWKAARIHDTRGGEEPERRAALAIAGQRAGR